MADAVTARTRMILLCTPNNPTGPILTTEETERFIKPVPPDVVVVIDEAYQEFVRDEHAVDGIEMYRKYPNVVVLRTFSKAHGLAGLRVGYSVSRPELTQHLRVAATPFAVSQIAETAAVTSLEHFAEVVERVQSLVDERDRVTAGLRDLGWFVPEAQGNFVWLNLGDEQRGIRRPGGGAGALRARLRRRGRPGQYRRNRGQHALPGTLCDLYKTAAAFLALNMTAAAGPLRIK